MIDRKYGRVVNVSSVAAFAPYTNSGGMYIATKLMLLKFSEMIHNDYKSRNIYSCAVCPGFSGPQIADLVLNINNEEKSTICEGSGPVDAILAEAYGAHGVRAQSPDELDSKINEMLDSDLPVLFDCVVDKDENCYPMIPSGAAHNEMLFNDDGISMEVGDEGKVLI